MDNGRHSIDSIFTGRNVFYIPNYQRGYAWGEKQFKDFFEDFKTEYFVESYYYGTILLQPKGKEGKKEKYEIVDGQQRITTLVIFMNCLIKRLENVEMKDYSCTDLLSRYVKNAGVYILSLQNEDNNYFTTSIIDGAVIAETTTPSQQKLVAAKEYFNKELDKCSDEQLMGFVEKIAETRVLVYLINDNAEAAMIFETTNDRGKQLTNLEKTKSFLMYKAAIGLEESQQTIDKLQNRFNEIYRDYSSIEKYLRDENSILQYSFIAYEPWTNTGSVKEYQHYMESMKKRVDEFVKCKDEKGLREYINVYTNNIQQSFSAIKAMYASKCLEFHDIVSLGRIANFLPLLIKCYRFDTSDDRQNYKRICRLCEIFSFRVYVIFEYKSSKYQTKWYELARDFNGDFNSLEGKIVSLIRSLKNDNEFVKKISRPDFYTAYYRTMDRNYFFWKYENYLRETEQPVATKMSHDDLNEKKDKRLTLTIEHIVAQRNTDEQSRVANSSLKITVGKSKSFNEKYLNYIGNLTIDPQSPNSSKGKKDVEKKVNQYFIVAPYKCQNELSSFLENDKWTIKSIEKRADKIIEFAKATWCDFSGYAEPTEEIYVDNNVDSDLEEYDLEFQEEAIE